MRTQIVNVPTGNYWHRLISSISDRRYRVQAFVAFRLVDLGADLKELAAAIRDVDREFPWQDQRQNGHRYKSIGYLNRGEIIYHSDPPEALCWFRLTPGNRYLRKNQKYAYEKYLFNLEKELAARKLPHVSEIRTVMEASVTSRHVVS